MSVEYFSKSNRGITKMFKLVLPYTNCLFLVALFFKRLAT